MPLPPKKRIRPFLDRQAKRQRPQNCTHYPTPPSTPETPTSTSQVSPTPPLSPFALPYSYTPHSELPPLLRLPDDVFLRIVEILQNGSHLRGPVFQTARNAFPLALASRETLAQFSKSLHTIDVSKSTLRDPTAPPLLREHLPHHIRSLVILAGSNLRKLRLPRYDHSQIGAEAILPVIAQCKSLTELSFVDHGRIDRALTTTIFANSLQVISIEKPSPQVVESLAKTRASLRVITLSDIPFAAKNHVVELLRSRGAFLEKLSLRFDGRSIRVVEDSAKKAADTSATAEVRTVLELLYNSFEEWTPALRELEVTCSEDRDLEHSQLHVETAFESALGEITTTVNELRQNSDGTGHPNDLRLVSVCLRTLQAMPRLLQKGQIRVWLPGFEARFNGAGKRIVKPWFWRFQMTSSLRNLDVPELWRLTGGADTLNIGDEDMVRSFDEMKEDFRAMIANMRNLRRVIVRIAMSDVDLASKVMRYITFILRVAPWVREVEVSHEIVSHREREEFSDMIKSMSMLRVIHLNTPISYIRGIGKGRLIEFAKNLPKVLRMLAEFSKDLEVLYCERLGEGRVVCIEKSKDELIRKLGEIDVIIEGRLSRVDLTSLKALVVAWVESIKP